MCFWKSLFAILSLMFITASVCSQSSDSVFNFSGMIYDTDFNPVPTTHVININTHVGVVSDSLGIYRLPVHSGDTLLFRNIAFQEIRLAVARILSDHYVLLERVIYPLQEARVFPWGSSYDDFSRAMLASPAPQTLGESLGLPRQDPDYVPYDMDESRLKSTGFLLSSPISYIYYNLSRKEKNRRKLYWGEKNRKKNEAFESIVAPENISRITGITGDPLLEFMAYLFQRLVCDIKCTELQVYSEIYAHWEVYQQLHPEIDTSHK